jgi:hypothetical protein
MFRRQSEKRGKLTVFFGGRMPHQELYFDIRIESPDPSVPTPVLFQNIKESIPEISHLLESRSKVKGIRFERRRGIPLDLTTVVFTVAVIVGTKLTETLTEKAVADIYDWIKRKCGNAEIVRPPQMRPIVEQFKLSKSPSKTRTTTTKRKSSKRKKRPSK